MDALPLSPLDFPKIRLASTLSDLIHYEFPLNERIRVLMRLEQLFQQADHFMAGRTTWDSRAVVASLMDILAIFGRNDLKSEIIKELDRHTNTLSRMADSKGVNHGKLHSTLSELEQLSQEICNTNGKIGGALIESELFKSISQRSAIPGGTCMFDLPAYHFWLEHPEAQRRQNLELWLRPLDTIRRAIDLILKLIRLSAVPSEEVAHAGFFQQNLEKGLPYQLIRVATAASLPYFVEISGGKHRFTVRFMTFSESERPVQADDDIPFQLTCCML